MFGVFVGMVGLWGGGGGGVGCLWGVMGGVRSPDGAPHKGERKGGQKVPNCGVV